MSTTPYPATKKRNSFIKWVIALLILSVLAFAAVKMLGGHKPKEDPAAAAMAGGMPVSVASVMVKPVTAWSEFSGRMEAVNSAEIRPRVSGQIAAVHFKDGEWVKRGQLLFTLDTRPYEAELARARGQLAAAASAQRNAAQDFSRAQTLIKTKAISKAEFERAQSTLQQANGTLESARGAARGAEVNLSYARITAPISGTISRAELTVGNNVEAGGSAPLLASIVDLKPIYASFELDERTYLSTLQSVPVGQLKNIPVEVLLGEGASALKATIHSFDNQIAPGSGTIRVRAVLPNENMALLPGMFARVRIGSAENTSFVLINPVAVGTDQNKKFVYVVSGEGKAEYREITPGQIVEENLQIVKSGLKEGDQIVVGGLQRLRPGAPVTPIPTDMQTLKPLNPQAEHTPASMQGSPAPEAKEAAPAESK